ncbi:hypothetical protein ABTN34_18525, partial [Acinetobacter baumannii]
MTDITTGCPVPHDGADETRLPVGSAPGDSAPEGRLPSPTAGDANRVWWPERLNLRILAKNPAVANPVGEEF